MTRIDHAIVARAILSNIEPVEMTNPETGNWLAKAQVSALLALVEQQRIANMQVEVSRLRVAANHRAGTQSGTDLSRQAYALEAQIAEGLGL
jgi:hypothetical protein